MKWLFLLPIALSAQAKDFTITWDPSATPGVYYKVWSTSGGSASVIRTTTATMAVVTLSPGTYGLYVTAVATNTVESDPSNTYTLPPPPTVPAGTTISTNSTPVSQTFLVQAESGVLAAPMGAVQISGATGSAVRTTTLNSGTGIYAFTLGGGTYVVWARMIASAGSADSFFVSVDGANEDVFGNEAGISPNWQWRMVTGGNGGPVRTFALPAGPHTFTFRGREVAVPLDAIYVTSDMNFVPQ